MKSVSLEEWRQLWTAAWRLWTAPCRPQGRGYNKHQNGPSASSVDEISLFLEMKGSLGGRNAAPLGRRRLQQTTHNQAT